MASSKPDSLHLGYLPQLAGPQPLSGTSTSNGSPSEAVTNPLRSPYTLSNGIGAAGTTNNPRIGAGSPSLELGGSRLFPKRAREIQAQERLTPSLWGPPTSGNSTPLRENIPESPTDGFPDLVPLPSDISASNSARRARAGTVPSRFSPGGAINGMVVPQTLIPNTSRPTPTGSPFKSGSPANGEVGDNSGPVSSASHAALLSRLRSGSLPQRNSYGASAGPFGPTLFSTNWVNGRDRATTVNSLGSTNGPTSPAQSSFSKDGIGDNEMRTLDYLGLADTPQQARATLAPSAAETLMEAQRAAAMQPFIADMAVLNKNLNRFRSYSVNAKEKYAEEEDEELGHGTYAAQHSGSLTPSAASAQAALAATQAQIHQHNLAVQAFANQASASRPRARTAGVLESPHGRSMRSYLATPSRLDSSITAADLRMAEAREYDGLPEAVRALQLGLSGRGSIDNETTLEGPTRALWLGSIPSSTTITSLNAIFAKYGKIESARVLTHKNCGFINFELVESAIQAKSMLSGQEIFPGAGPIRIGYAKVPDSSSGTPGASGAFPSPSPDPFASGLRRQSANDTDPSRQNSLNGAVDHGGPSRDSGAIPLPELAELQSEMVQIVEEFGATADDQQGISDSIRQAIQFDSFEAEIPPIQEPTHGRVHDAPKLREIRKRIDNNSCSPAEIEEIALGMLPEIAELASDYLGNTVVQKLFEYCSEGVKESMLREIAPHLAEIGVHKNGTWAAQKIIDVSKTPTQMATIVQSLRPYTVALFLDQYGNYVLQCVLRFGAPWNNFIFESMLSRMWDIAQGRFGARAMRACLESHHATKDQQRMLAAAVALHSVQLATNANGALLLTWFLDTCTFPRRRTVLAPRLVPHLVQLCTHKVAYLTVLKVINQRNEPEARDTILRSLFFSASGQTLEEILRDPGCGATLIFKVLTTPFFEESMRAEVVQNIRTVLVRLKAQPSQGYKRLMDEVGLSTRNGPAGGGSNRDSYGGRDSSVGRSDSRDRQRPSSRQHGSTSHTPNPIERQYNGQFMTPAQQLGYEPNPLSRSHSVDATAMSGLSDQFGLMGVANNPLAYAQQGGSMPLTPVSPQQLQYQQALLAASVRSFAPAANIYPGMSPNPMNGGYGSPSPSSLDSYRNLQGHSPIPPPPPNPSMNPSPMMNGQSPFAPPGGQFAQMMGGAAMGFQYPGMGVGGMQYVGAQQGGNRRGRR
ncbi:MAG: hypothetical protein M1817_001238 [Caeruleum heppii]|nr:MAG: hypothetical protein M1817_001238 [Caeruleum heppii]